MMLRPGLTFAVAVVASAAAIACSNSPSSPTQSAVSIAAPSPLRPSADASLRFADQPIAVAVQNATMKGATGVIYTFEVATDSAFASKVQTKDNVSEGTNGQTTVQLDPLAGGKDYYWHARATGGGATSPFSPTYKFTIGPAVIVNSPVPIGPLAGATTTPRPALRVMNVTRTGPAGPFTYLFEIANSSAFTNVIVTATQTEGVDETGFIPSSDLPINATLYWRASGVDANTGVSSTPTAVQSFATRAFTQAETVAEQLGVPLWPGMQPSGNPGHATMGNDRTRGVGWNVQTLHYVPANVSFQSPDIEMLRYFDLWDRGFDPDSAIAWMNANGYPSIAKWYPGPEKAVLGLKYVYIAARDKVVTNATWDMVLRVE